MNENRRVTLTHTPTHSSNLFDYRGWEVTLCRRATSGVVVWAVAQRLDVPHDFDADLKTDAFVGQGAKAQA